MGRPVARALPEPCGWGAVAGFQGADGAAETVKPITKPQDAEISTIRSGPVKQASHLTARVITVASKWAGATGALANLRASGEELRLAQMPQPDRPGQTVPLRVRGHGSPPSAGVQVSRALGVDPVTDGIQLLTKSRPM